MRLDELRWEGPYGGRHYFAHQPTFHVWRYVEYEVYDLWRKDGNVWWTAVDALTAQAILFELTSVNRMNQNRTTEPYPSSTNSPNSSNT